MVAVVKLEDESNCQKARLAQSVRTSGLVYDTNQIKQCLVKASA